MEKLKPTNLELSYIAGLFDGEGHVSIVKENAGGIRKSPVHRLEAAITNGNYSVLSFVKQIFGGDVRVHDKNNPARKHIIYRWRIACTKAGVFLGGILPYLHIKGTQVGVALEFTKLIRQHGTQLTPEQIDERERYKLLVSSLAERNKPQEENCGSS